MHNKAAVVLVIDVNLVPTEPQRVGAPHAIGNCACSHGQRAGVHPVGFDRERRIAVGFRAWEQTGEAYGANRRGFFRGGIFHPVEQLGMCSGVGGQGLRGGRSGFQQIKQGGESVVGLPGETRALRPGIKKPGRTWKFSRAVVSTV